MQLKYDLFFIFHLSTSLKNYVSVLSKVFFLFLLLFQNTYSQPSKQKLQNILKNGGFEEVTVCPDNFGQIESATGWLNLNYTPDLFTKCSKENKIHSPSNFFGTQIPADGANYAGIVAYHEQSPNEFVGAELSEPLEKGKKYTVRFRVSLAEAYSNYACAGLGMLFVNEIPKELVGQNPQVLAHEIIQESKAWATISQNFLADDNYKKIIIGNFVPKERTKIRKVQSAGYPVAYYFIDGVEVSKYTEQNDEENFIKVSGRVYDALTNKSVDARIDFVLESIKYRVYEKTKSETGRYEFSHLQKVPQFYLEAKAKGYYSTRVFLQSSDTTHFHVKDFKMQPSTLGTSFVLQDLHFETNSAKIIKDSYPGLDMLAEFLQTHANFHIEIGGHTDSQGDDARNLILSEDRAKSVATYLEQHGFVNANRMNTKGYGEAQAIASNEDAEGRLQNRRVEIKIVKE